MPCPNSTLPLAIDTVPSRSKCTRCERRRASVSGAGFSASIEDRAHYAVVRAAPAEVLVERLADFGLRGIGVLREKRNGAHHDAAHAVAALRGLVPEERLLHRVLGLQALDRRDLLAGGERKRRVARSHGAAVDQGVARAALSAAAAKTRADEAQIIAQHVEERRVGMRRDALGRAVHFEFRPSANFIRASRPRHGASRRRLSAPRGRTCETLPACRPPARRRAWSGAGAARASASPCAPRRTACRAPRAACAPARTCRTSRRRRSSPRRTPS